MVKLPVRRRCYKTRIALETVQTISTVRKAVHTSRATRFIFATRIWLKNVAVPLSIFTKT